MRRLVLLLAMLAAAEARASGLVDELRGAGATLHPLGMVAGLEGYWVEPAAGGGWPLYVTEEGHGVVGLLHDAAGRPVTAAQIAASGLGGAAAGEEAREAFGAALEAAAFRTGREGPDVVVFADPACPWSRAAVARFAAQSLAGGLVLHVVPVALLGEASARMALAVVAAADPLEAWFAGGAASGDEEARRRIAANNRLFAALGGRAVPFTVRALPDGLATREGAIDDPLSWLGPW